MLPGHSNQLVEININRVHTVILSCTEGRGELLVFALRPIFT